MFEWKNHVPFFQGKIFPKYGQNHVKQSKWTCNFGNGPIVKGIDPQLPEMAPNDRKWPPNDRKWPPYDRNLPSSRYRTRAERSITTAHSLEKWCEETYFITTWTIETKTTHKI